VLPAAVEPPRGRLGGDAKVKELPRGKFEAREIAKLLEAVDETLQMSAGGPRVPESLQATVAY
jgi:hypothetical protein